MSNTKLDQELVWNFPITAGAVSETGAREENQDRMTRFSCPLGMVSLIADGMGGHKGGAEAARMVTDGFERHLMETSSAMPPEAALSEAARETNRELLSLSRSGDPTFEGMGSTVAIALVRQGGQGLEVITAHMGDTRVYLHRAGQLILLTRDHTRVQWLIDSHAIDEEEARYHPDSSILTRAMGQGAETMLEFSAAIPLGDTDAIILCSDGLSAFVPKAEINRVIQQFPDPRIGASELVKLALERGSNDNITVQFLRVGGSPQPVIPVIKPAKKTAPEAPAMIAPVRAAPVPAAPRAAAPAAAKPSRRWILAVVGGLALALAGALAFRSEVPSVGAPAQSLTDSRIARLQDRATNLQVKASKGQRTAEGALAAIARINVARMRNRSARNELIQFTSDESANMAQFQDLVEYTRVKASAFNQLYEQSRSVAHPSKTGTEKSSTKADSGGAPDTLASRLDAEEKTMRVMENKLSIAMEKQKKLEVTRKRLLGDASAAGGKP